MERAAEASVQRGGGSVVGDTLSVVKLPTHRNHAAPHILTALLTHKAGVDAWKKSNTMTNTRLLSSVCHRKHKLSPCFNWFIFPSN